MFAIHTPQTIELAGAPNEDGSPTEATGTVTFQHGHDDVSECQMIVASKDRVWTYNFNVNGGMIGWTYEDDETRAKKKAAEEEAAQAKKDADAEAKAEAEKAKEEA